MSTYIDPVTGKPGRRRPPVIPEIAKAFQNDPRTQLAAQALAAGSSGAPVAEGQYGMADGIARMLQGLGGAYMQKKQMEGYRADEDQLRLERQKRGVDGINGNPAAPPSVANAGQIATALGAPPPAPAAMAPQPPAGVPMPPQGPPGLPMAPIPPQAAPMPPVQGAGPGGRRPFGPSAATANGPSFLQAPVAEAVPEAPAPVEKPKAPDAVGPTRSRLLDAAYKIMADGNAYESSRGQDMYVEGLGDQTKLDESATERKQHLIDMEYQSDRGMYADAAGQDRGAKLNERASTVEHNRQMIDTYYAQKFQYGVHKEDQAFEAHQKAMDRASAMQVAQVRASISASGGSTALTPEERAALSKAANDGRLDIRGVTKFQAKVLAQALVDNPDLNTVQLHARSVLAANPQAQRQAMVTEILPDVLSNVRDAGKKLKYSDFRFAGNLQAFAKGQLNDPDFVNYMTQRNDAMLTVAQVMRGTGATDLSTRMEAEAAHPTLSPKAWDGWYNAQLTALLPRVRIAEKRGLVDPGTTATIEAAHGLGTGTMPTSTGWGAATVVP